MRVKGRPSGDERRTLAKRCAVQQARDICDGTRHDREAIQQPKSDHRKGRDSHELYSKPAARAGRKRSQHTRIGRRRQRQDRRPGGTDRPPGDRTRQGHRRAGGHRPAAGGDLYQSRSGPDAGTHRRRHREKTGAGSGEPPPPAPGDIAAQSADHHHRQLLHLPAAKPLQRYRLRPLFPPGRRDRVSAA